MAEAKAQVRDAFLKQIKALIAYCEADEKGILGEEPGKFYSPDKGDWDGDVFDAEGMSQAFKREEIHEDFRSTVTDDGLTTDLEICTLQGDFVGLLERAYRARHHTPIRARCHAAARRAGHANENGLYTKGLQGYLEHLKRLEGGS